MAGGKVSPEGDISGMADTLVRVVTPESRHTVLRRTFDKSKTGIKEKLIVANTTQMLIVVAVTNPEPKPDTIDRVIVNALGAGVKLLLAIMRTDLDAILDLTSWYKTLLPVWELCRDNYDIREFQNLRERLRGETTMLLGHSGVRKSTLVNALVPAVQRITGEIN